MNTTGWSRRDGLIGLASLGLAGWAAPAAAGQLEEPLADSVRGALSAAIANKAPPVPEFDTTEKRLAYLRWLGAMSERLQQRKPDFQTRVEFLQTVWYETRRAGLDTSLVLGIQVRRVALLLAAYSAVTSLFHYIPSDPWQMSIFVKNWSLAGGFLVLAASRKA